MRLFVLLGSLLVIGLIAALVVPPYVDWNQYRDQFEREASRVLGHTVEVRGETRVRLLPLPSITFSDLRVGKNEGNTPLLTAKSFKMNVELAPLLKGDVVVVDMALDQPRFELEMTDKGEVLWPVAKGSQGRDFSVSEASLDNFVITNGLVRFRDARYQREIILKNIDVLASAKSFLGPWRGNAFLNYENTRFRLFGTTGVWQNDKGDQGHVRVKLTIQPQNSVYDFELDGPVNIANFVPSFKGRLQVKPAMKQSDEDLISFRRNSLEKALPIRLETDLEITSSEAVIPAFKLDIGARSDPYSVTGTGRIELNEAASFQLRAEGQQVNVERLSGGEYKAGGLSLTERISALQAVLERVPRFGIEGEVSLYLPAIVAGDTVIRDVGMDIRPTTDGEGWQLSNLEAHLPGRTDLRANGKLHLGKNTNYVGELIIASKQPSGLAAWLGADTDTAMRELPRVGFSSQVKISSQSAVFEELEISLGGRSLLGNLRRDISKDGRPKLTTELTGDGVNFDQLMALGSLFTGKKSSLTGGHDIDLDLKADRMIVFGVEASKVVAKVAYENSRLAIEQLKIMNIEGAAVSLSGVLDDFPTQSTGDLKGTFVAKNPIGILKLLRKKMPKLEMLQALIDDSVVVENTDLSFTLKGEGTRYSSSVKGESGGSDVEFILSGSGGDLSKSLGEQNIETRLVLVNQDAAKLLLQIGVPVVPLAIAGRGALRITASGVPQRGMKTDAALTLRDGYLSVAGLVSTRTAAGEDGLSGVLNVVSEVQDFDPLILLSGFGLPGFGEGYSGKLSGKLKFDDGIYSIHALKAKIGDGLVQGNITLDSTAKPRPFIRGAVDVSPMNLSSVANLVFTGGQDTISPAVLSGLDAAIDLTSSRVVLPTGMDEVKAVSSKLVLRDGDLSFDKIDGSWAKGKITGLLTFAQINGTQLLNGKLELKGGELKEIASISGFSDAFSGGIDVAGTFESTGKEKNSLLSELTGSGTVQLTKGTIKNFNGQALKSLLAGADQTKDEVLSESAGELLKKNFYQGTAFFDDAEISFNIGAGVLRANGIQLANKNVTASGNGRLNMISGVAEASGRVAFVAGKETVTGASPEFSLRYKGVPGTMKAQQDAGLLGTFLALRSSERRQRKFEAQQSEILERQRLQRTARLYTLKADAKRIFELEKARVEQIKTELEKQRLLEAEKELNEQAELAKQKADAIKKKAIQEDKVRLEAEAATKRLKEKQRLDSLSVDPGQLSEPAL
ncbi:MAG: AsmA-like C-terminal region-containing protein [Rhizobiaceae bacterium]